MITDMEDIFDVLGMQIRAINDAQQYNFEDDEEMLQFVHSRVDIEKQMEKIHG